MTRFERPFAWLGGAMFVASLAFCAYSFIFPWSAPHAPNALASIFDALLFSVFALQHSLFARTRVKGWLSRFIPHPMLRSVYVWVASLLLIAVCAAWQPVGGVVYRHAGSLGIAHALVQLLGVWLIARSAKTIDVLELAGIRHLSPKRREGGKRDPTDSAERLQIAGPYRFVRHPIYLGWLLVVFGPALMTGDRLAFAGITTAYLLIAIPWEERSLHAEFGDEYDRYTRQVKWRLVPYVY